MPMIKVRPEKMFVRTAWAVWVACLLLLCPFVVYQSAITHRYGMRDDYSLLREAHEEPGKAIWFTGSHGRPIYGSLLEAGFKPIQSVDDLRWLRLVSVALLAWFGCMVWRQLRASGWHGMDAFGAALTLALLPASQITASWTVGWPWGFTLILAVAGFRLVDTAYRQSGVSQRFCRLLAALGAYILAALIYQSNVLFAVVLLAAAILSPTNQASGREIGKRIFFHLLVLASALAIYYALLQALFARHLLYESGRLQLETGFVSKLEWFFLNPLPNALAFFTLRDDFNTGATFFWSGAAVVLGLMVAAIYSEPDLKRRWVWLFCLCVLPWIAHAISLVAAERVIGYRTCYALSGLVVVLLFMALRRLINADNTRAALHGSVVVLLLLFFGFQAWHQSRYLIVLPQEREWNMIHSVVDKLPVKEHVSAYLIEPNVKDRSTNRVFRDEFGSLSTDSDWTPKEMFKDALHQRFPQGVPKGESISFLYTKVLPDSKAHYDYLIDMRKLKHWRN